MAATIARVIGTGKDSVATAERPGTVSAEAQANTFKTFTTTKINADGSGSMQVERTTGNGERVVIGRMDFGPEDSGILNYVGISGEAGHHVPLYAFESITKQEATHA
jgi:hypothetical protein